MILRAIFGVSTLVLLAGCAVTTAPLRQVPRPNYEVRARVVSHVDGTKELRLSTRANCPGVVGSRAALERLELRSPSGRPLQSLTKPPTHLGGGVFVGVFTVEMPAAVPPGPYPIRLTFDVDGRTCATHEGNFRIG